MAVALYPSQSLLEYRKDSNPLEEPAIQQEVLFCPMDQLRVARLLQRTEAGVLKNLPAESVDGCTGGVYVLRDGQRKPCAIFKPISEEPFAIDNKKGYAGGHMFVPSPMKDGVLVGEGAIRELAAYLLDHESFSGVSPTTLVRVRGELGSLQEYVPYYCSAEDLGSGVFSVDEVHKVAILDIRIANLDRHVDNLLVTRGTDGQYVLTPIDHGSCLPQWDSLSSIMFEWSSWPQTRVPFDTRTREYIAALDGAHDAQLLESIGVRRECAVTVWITTRFLQMSASLDLTPHMIAQAVRGNDSTSSSTLQSLVHAAVLCANGGPDNSSTSAAFFHHFERLVTAWATETAKSAMS